MTNDPVPADVLGARHAASALSAAFERTDLPPLPAGELAVPAASWLRERTVRTLRTAAHPRAAYDAATPLARELHKATCTWPAGAGECPSLASVAETLIADMVGDSAGDLELGTALAAAAGDTVNAFAAFTAAAIVAVDGPGAGAVIAGLRSSVQ